MSEMGQVSDGYHTFDELYTHRHLLFCLVVTEDPLAWKSRAHYNHLAPMYPGWFIAGTLLHGAPITYHLPLDYLDLCHAEELPSSPEWDGHTSMDVCGRIREYLKTLGKTAHE